ncbi:hypothetical protein GCM10025782_25990 [Pedococcus ginsenosidimutans]|uniref:Uncharacterized protein n=1 Tax=Pedococcus ginsenosidimutans TaxID=490570 RepID=A0ABP8YG76_9MICO
MEDLVDEGVEQRILVREVVVDRHALHAEAPPEGPHGQRRQTALVRKSRGLLEDALHRQGTAV